MLTLPAAALFGAAAAAIALTGPIGVLIVLVALIAGTGAILTISRRTAVTRHNVTDARDVTVRFSRVPTAMIAPVALPVPPAIPPIVIKQAIVPAPADTIVKGSQS
jgi:PiT family inorganic phosphate transporter